MKTYPPSRGSIIDQIEIAKKVTKIGTGRQYGLHREARMRQPIRTPTAHSTNTEQNAALGKFGNSRVSDWFSSDWLICFLLTMRTASPTSTDRSARNEFRGLFFLNSATALWFHHFLDACERSRSCLIRALVKALFPFESNSIYCFYRFFFQLLSASSLRKFHWKDMVCCFGPQQRISFYR